MSNEAKIYFGQYKHKIVVELPLTRPTSKIRVKRKHEGSNYGIPIATRQEPFTNRDYVEWEISYATLQPPEHLKVDGISIVHNKQTWHGFELTKILYEGLNKNIITHQDLENLLAFSRSIQENETLEENETIVRGPDNKEVRGGFKKFTERVPLFIKECDSYFVEIALRHKQRAVGLQGMVCLCIYTNTLKDQHGNSIIGRKANKKEYGHFEIGQSNKDIVFNTVKAFAINSQQHKSDITSILNQVKKKCSSI